MVDLITALADTSETYYYQGVMATIGAVLDYKDEVYPTYPIYTLRPEIFDSAFVPNPEAKSDRISAHNKQRRDNYGYLYYHIYTHCFNCIVYYGR